MIGRTETRYYLKLKALHYIYEKNYTHTRTAELLGISRVTLYRLLEEAEREGMLKIDIIDTQNLKSILLFEDRLKAKYGLKDIKLIDTDVKSSSDIAYISAQAATYVDRYIRSGMNIGIAWGRALGAMFTMLPISPGIKGLNIYTLIGGACNEVDFQPPALAQELLRHYNGSCHVINAPYMCHSASLCTELRSEPSIAQILTGAEMLDLALVGVGENPSNESFKKGYFHLPDDIISELAQVGAVGDICGNFFDISGTPCQTSFSDRVVTINLPELKKCKNVIAIAYGDHKVEPIIGALNGGYIDTLITNINTAEKLLSYK